MTLLYVFSGLSSRQKKKEISYFKNVSPYVLTSETF